MEKKTCIFTLGWEVSYPDAPNVWEIYYYYYILIINLSQIYIQSYSSPRHKSGLPIVYRFSFKQSEITRSVQRSRGNGDFSYTPQNQYGTQELVVCRYVSECLLLQRGRLAGSMCLNSLVFSGNGWK